MNSDYLRSQTIGIRTGHQRTNENEHSAPIFLTSSFVFKDAQQAAERFSNPQSGNIYTRYSNPTVKIFEERLAALEGGTHCFATASGMSAIFSVCMALLSSGDHLIASRGLFGTTTALFRDHFSRFKIDVDFLSFIELDHLSSMIRPNTKIIFVESPSNPLCEIIDIAKVVEYASIANDCKVVVDNCLCSPALQRPLEFGADIVLHSATKHLDGQGRGLGGAIVTSNECDADKIFSFLRTSGPSMSPFNAWMFLGGLETLVIRMREASRSAHQIAHWLNQCSVVQKVYYPGIEQHPGHETAKRQQNDFGPLLAFEISGGREIAWKVINSMSMISITANFGDVKTTITHPASTTHSRLSEYQRELCGVTENLIRLSVGLEAVDDIITDLDTGLSKL